MTQTVPDISPLMPMHQDPLLVKCYGMEIGHVVRQPIPEPPPRACRHGADTEAPRPHDPSEDRAPEDETPDNRTPDEPQWPDPKSEYQDSSPGTGRQDDTPRVSHFPASSSKNASSKTQRALLWCMYKGCTRICPIKHAFSFVVIHARSRRCVSMHYHNVIS